jgi:hypothetical protein
MRFLPRAVFAAFSLLALSACGTNPDGTKVTAGQVITKISDGLIKIDTGVRTYAPIIGKGLVAFGDAILQVECSPIAPAGGAAAANVLMIVAPSSTLANKFATRVQQNDDIAAQICPLYQQIKTAVGSVPQTATPVAIIPTTVPAAGN